MQEPQSHYTKRTKLFIVDDNKLLAADLTIYLSTKFGGYFDVLSFFDGETCLKKIDENTGMVILDYNLEGKNGIEILKLIKAMNPETEVILFTGCDGKVTALESFKNGASDFVVKGVGYRKKIADLVSNFITKLSVPPGFRFTAKE